MGYHYVYGRPTERHELSGTHGQPLFVGTLTRLAKALGVPLVRLLP